MKNPWLRSDKCLPPADGIYEITHLSTELIQDRSVQGLAYYDGTGFVNAGIYKQPTFWRKWIAQPKIYGEVPECSNGN
jgi:hypothetical protein